nr:MAG TPA: hypothetical protein [Caudoviricetes sp.]
MLVCQSFIVNKSKSTAKDSQSKGQGFDPPMLHEIKDLRSA